MSGWKKYILGGREWNCKNAIIEENIPAGLCHNNSIDAWLQRDNVNICTGYALSGDRWLRHSWIIDYEGNIHECTPSRRDKYFGVVLEDAEAELFRRDWDFEYGAKCAKAEADAPAISSEDIAKKTLQVQENIVDKNGIIKSIGRLNSVDEVSKND